MVHFGARVLLQIRRRTPACIGKCTTEPVRGTIGRTQHKHRACGERRQRTIDVITRTTPKRIPGVRPLTAGVVTIGRWWA